MVTLLIFVAGVGLLVAAALAVRHSVSSGREGPDPHCVACGRNVVGITSGRCPECGVELDAKAVTRGRPTASRAGLAVAGAMALSGLLLAAGGGRDLVRQDWSETLPPMMPTWWLVARYDVRHPWQWEIAQVLQDRFTHGSMSLEARLALGMERFPLVVEARREARAGGPLPLHVFTSAGWTSGSRSSGEPEPGPPHRIGYRLLSMQIGDAKPVEWTGTGGSMHGYVSYDRPRSIKVPSDTPPGRTRLRMTYRAQLAEPQEGYSMPHLEYPIVSETFTVDVPFEVLPADSGNGIEFVRDPQLAAKMDAAFAPRGVPLGETRVDLHLREERDDQFVDLQIEHGALPVPFAGEIVIIDAAGREWSHSEHGCDATSRHILGSSGGTEEALHDFVGDAATIVIRSKPSVAARTHDIYRIWGEEIVIPNVPVSRRLSPGDGW